jgi:hypothetical protein
VRAPHFGARIFSISASRCTLLSRAFSLVLRGKICKIQLERSVVLSFMLHMKQLRYELLIRCRRSEKQGGGWEIGALAVMLSIAGLVRMCRKTTCLDFRPGVSDTAPKRNPEAEGA